MAPIAYIDFDLQIERAPHGYRAIVNSASGQISQDFNLPFSDLELENFVLRMGYTRRAVRSVDSPQIEAVKTFGGQLFAAVFANDIGKSLYSQLDALQHDAGLRLRLDLTTVPELLDLPWEYLYNSALDRFLALSAKTPIVRYLELPERVHSLAVTPPLRVLVMIASPRDYAPLDVEREWAKLHEALGGLEQRGLVTLDRLEQATLPALQRQLRRGMYHIFHFIGHGGFDQRIQDGVLIMEDEDTSGRRIDAQELGTLLHDEDTLRLAVLNACEGARTSRTDPFAGTAQTLVRQGTPAVIAMQFEITDDAAITLAREFYGALADDYPVDAALGEARKALSTEGHGVEWGTPVLYMRAPDGKIFDVAPVSASDSGLKIAVPEIAPTQRNDEARSVAQPVAALASPEQRNRDRMLQKVRAFWVEGVLENSLHGAALIALGLEQHPDAVAHPWEMLVQQGDRPPQSFAPDTTIAKVFDEFGGEMLILGAPGAGKTTLLLELARDLIARAQWDTSHPLPVVFNLASWSRRRRPLTDWLIQELNARYDVPRKIGQVWVDAEQILPLLDGLDEVQEEYRAACVEAINTFRHDHGLVNLVVCSRIADYDALAARLKLQSAILVQPLTPAQIDTYLAHAGGQLAVLRAVLAEDATLRELAESPLLLSVMTLTYADVTADALPTHGTLDERRTHLFAEYVNRMFARRGVDTRYPRQQVLRWLSWLAHGMTQQAQSVFFIERLQPDWLPPHAAHWQYRVIDRLGGALICGGVAGLVIGLVGALTTGLLNALILVLVWGIVLALVAGLFGGESEMRGGFSQSIWRSARNAILGGVVIGLADGLVFAGLYYGLVHSGLRAELLSRMGDAPGGVLGELLSELGDWLLPVSGLYYGLIIGGLCGGLAGGFAGTPSLRLRRILVIETLRWSWVRVRRSAMNGLVVGLGLGLLGGLLSGLIWGVVFGLKQGLVMGLSIGLAVGLINALVEGLAGALIYALAFGLIGGLVSGEIEAKVAPNQGIRRSARSALLSGLVFGVGFGVPWGLLVGMAAGLTLGLSSAVIGAILVGLVGALAYGGYACISHLALRLVLWRHEAMPWNYARFLDYCAERIFLRKVGGGYIFVHRLLMEYFAVLEQGKTPQGEA